MNNDATAFGVVTLQPFQPDPFADLRLVAAKHVLGVLPSWELPAAADRALASGLYSHALAELAAEHDPGTSVVAPLFVAALRELGLLLPTKVEAAWTLAHDRIASIAAGLDAPEPALRMLEAVRCSAVDVIPDTEHVGQGLDIGRLIAIYWSYSEPNENYFAPEDRVISSELERRSILDRLARVESQAWLTRRATTDPER